MDRFRHILQLCALVFLTAPLFLAAHPAAAQRSPDQGDRQLHSVRFQCGGSSEGFQEGVVRGRYATPPPPPPPGITLSNPSATDPVAFEKSVSRALPFQRFDGHTAPQSGSVPPLGAIEIECDEIRMMLPHSMTAQFRSGVLRVVSDGPLIVVATYTSRPVAGGASSIDIETVKATPLPGSGQPDSSYPACDLDDATSCGDDGSCTRLLDTGQTYCECRDGFAGARCEANLRPLRKRLNAGPGDFFTLRLPRPEAIGSRSRSQVFDVDLDETCTWSEVLPIDFAGAAQLIIGTAAGGDGAEWVLDLTDPNGAAHALPEPVDPKEALDEMPSRAYRIEFDEVGSWQATLTDPGGCAPGEEGFIGLASLPEAEVPDGGTGLYVYPSRLDLVEDGPVSILAYAYDLEAFPEFVPPAEDVALEESSSFTVPDPLADATETAELTVRLPGGELLDPVQMFDDGTHEDGEAGDGIFGATLPTDDPGIYTALVEIAGTPPGGAPFRRNVEIPVPVARRSIAIDRDGDFADGLGAATARLGVIIPIEIDGDVTEEEVNDSEYFVASEIWGEDQNGEYLPVAWTGNLRVPFIGPVADGPSFSATEVELDGQWISNLRFSRP